MTDSPDPGLFDVSDAGAAPGARVVPAGQHPWAPTAIQHWNKVGAEGLWLISLLREAIDDADKRTNVSLPGQAEPGEFYVEMIDSGINFAIRVEPM